MRDFKPKAFLENGPEWRRAVNWHYSNFGKSVHPKLYKCEETFVKNLVRIATFQVMPFELIFRVRKDDVFTLESFEKVTGSRPAGIDGLLNENPSAEVIGEIARRFSEFNNLSNEAILEYHDKIGVQYVEEMFKRDKEMQNSMDAMFAAIIMQSWTVFECLVSDLWCAGVDYGPRECANRVLLNKKIPTDDPITVQKVAESEYDARTRLGSFLRDAGRVSFQKLHYTKDWYEIAYGKDTANLFDSTLERRIYGLSALRNVFAHSGGIADRSFIKQAKGFPELEAFEAGKAILLDGEIVVKFRDAAAVLGRALIEGVSGQMPAPE